MSQALIDFVEAAAGISECGQYRYWLTRVWDKSKPVVAWIMLNPSTADALVDDPTIRRCMGFARAWGAGGIYVANLFAFRASNPCDLWKASDPVGPNNNPPIYAHTHGMRIVAAWGCQNGIGARVREVLKFLDGRQLECLGVTKDGHPRHPLYMAANTLPIPFPTGPTP
jgi:hypothetical protein